jgi:hypothetical protein
MRDWRLQFETKSQSFLSQTLCGMGVITVLLELLTVANQLEVRPHAHYILVIALKFYLDYSNTIFHSHGSDFPVWVVAGRKHIQVYSAFQKNFFFDGLRGQ